MDEVGEAVVVDEVAWKSKELDADGAGPMLALLAVLKIGVLKSRPALPPPTSPAPSPRPSVRRSGVSSNVYSGRPCGIAYPVDTWRYAVGCGWNMPEGDAELRARQWELPVAGA